MVKMWWKPMMMMVRDEIIVIDDDDDIESQILEMRGIGKMMSISQRYALYRNI